MKATTARLQCNERKKKSRCHSCDVLPWHLAQDLKISFTLCLPFTFCVSSPISFCPPMFSPPPPAFVVRLLSFNNWHFITCISQPLLPLFFLILGFSRTARTCILHLFYASSLFSFMKKTHQWAFWGLWIFAIRCVFFVTSPVCVMICNPCAE